MQQLSRRPCGRHKSATQQIYTQNCRGVKTDDRLTMLFDGLERRGAFAAFVQETWRVGEEAYEQQGCCFLGLGPEKQQGRGSLGLGIVLLSILPKKGDLSLPGNYRGIMMLEVCSKIVDIVLDMRLTPICEALDHALRRRDSHLCSRGGLPLLIVSHPDTPPASLIPTPYSYARECVLVCRRYDPC